MKLEYCWRLVKVKCFWYSIELDSEEVVALPLFLGSLTTLGRLFEVFLGGILSEKE